MEVLINVSALSGARKVESADNEVLMPAFDKAVRRKPLAFAADAVELWKLHVGEGGTWTAGSAIIVAFVGAVILVWITRLLKKA